jgi:hypothetical protein
VPGFNFKVKVTASYRKARPRSPPYKFFHSIFSSSGLERRAFTILKFLALSSPRNLIRFVISLFIEDLLVEDALFFVVYALLFTLFTVDYVRHVRKVNFFSCRVSACLHDKQKRNRESINSKENFHRGDEKYRLDKIR